MCESSARQAMSKFEVRRLYVIRKELLHELSGLPVREVAQYFSLRRRLDGVEETLNLLGVAVDKLLRQ